MTISFKLKMSICKYYWIYLRNIGVCIINIVDFEFKWNNELSNNSRLSKHTQTSRGFKF